MHVTLRTSGTEITIQKSIKQKVQRQSSSKREKGIIKWNNKTFYCHYVRGCGVGQLNAQTANGSILHPDKHTG